MTDDEHRDTDKYDKKYASIATGMLENKYVIPTSIESLVAYCRNLQDTEKQLTRAITAWVTKHPIYDSYLKHINGIGPVLSANLISMIEPVTRFEKPSKLVAYAGYSGQYYEQRCEAGHKFMTSSPKSHCPVRKKVEVNGKAEVTMCMAPVPEVLPVNGIMSRKSGYVMLVNTHLKTLMYKIGTSFEKLSPDKSYYRLIYDTQKALYNARETVTKGHARMMALRYTEKRFLINLHVVWMTGLGHKVTPYESTLENHTIDPILVDDSTPIPSEGSLKQIDTNDVWTIKQLTDSYYDVQKLRIKAFNNIVAWVKSNPERLVRTVKPSP